MNCPSCGSDDLKRGEGNLWCNNCGFFPIPFSDTPAHQWVKVTDGLPKDSDEYVVTLTFEEMGKKKRSVTTGRYYTSEKMWFVGGEQNFYVTHWLPFPEPPDKE